MDTDTKGHPMKTIALWVAGLAAVTGWGYLLTDGVAAGFVLLVVGALSLAVWWRLPEPVDVPAPITHEGHDALDGFGPYVQCDCGDRFETRAAHYFHAADMRKQKES